MIFNSRDDSLKLHQPDKRYLAGARAVLRNLARFTGSEAAIACLTNLQAVCDQFGVTGEEHLKPTDRPEPAKGKQ